MVPFFDTKNFVTKTNSVTETSIRNQADYKNPYANTGYFDFFDTPVQEAKAFVYSTFNVSLSMVREQEQASYLPSRIGKKIADKALSWYETASSQKEGHVLNMLA